MLFASRQAPSSTPAATSHAGRDARVINSHSAAANRARWIASGQRNSANAATCGSSSSSAAVTSPASAEPVSRRAMSRQRRAAANRQAAWTRAQRQQARVHSHRDGQHARVERRPQQLERRRLAARPVRGHVRVHDLVAPRRARPRAQLHPRRAACSTAPRARMATRRARLAWPLTRPGRSAPSAARAGATTRRRTTGARAGRRTARPGRRNGSGTGLVVARRDAAGLVRHRRPHVLAALEEGGEEAAARAHAGGPSARGSAGRRAPAGA